MYDNVTTTQVLSLNNISDPSEDTGRTEAEDQEEELILS